MTIDKTKLRALAQASIDHGIEQGSGDGWFSADHMLRYYSTDLEDGLVVEHATPQTIITLLDELQAMTDDRNSWEQQHATRCDDALKFAEERDELKRLTRNLLLALEGEALGKTGATSATCDAASALRKAVES